MSNVVPKKSAAAGPEREVLAEKVGKQGALAVQRQSKPSPAAVDGGDGAGLSCHVATQSRPGDDMPLDVDEFERAATRLQAMGRGRASRKGDGVLKGVEADVAEEQRIKAAAALPHLASPLERCMGALLVHLTCFR